MKISDVARLADVSVSTIRVWEQKGLLQPTYSPTGRRLYKHADVETAVSIKRMRSRKKMPIAQIATSLPAPGNVEPVSGIDGIGRLLREMRTARRLTQREVASAIGLTANQLASIERTSIGLDVPALKRIATFFGVTLNEIMGVDTSRSGQEIVMRDRGVLLPRLGVGVQIERLGSGVDVMDCQRWTLEPGVQSNGAYRHSGEEFIVVTSGTFEITLDDNRVHVLTKGDSIYFNSSTPHSWRSLGPGSAELIWVCVGDSF
ncbi:MAG: MerR family transcriptional regulator [Aquamicrobium sp.]|uniref:cupin domain-containing protein n=1 Tax=Aquamicrobium sp. TaxID=1872579 RepID=UPI00349E9E34|nr:MerR family transcriptional regulator [Aquamicrobium sp.]MCO5157936.1 MerR family transcriptional regulator [Aquamicrobium sp.]